MDIKKAKEKLTIIKAKVDKGGQTLADAISLCNGGEADDVQKLAYRAHEELSTAVTFLRNFDLIVEL